MCRLHQRVQIKLNRIYTPVFLSQVCSSEPELPSMKTGPKKKKHTLLEAVLESCKYYIVEMNLSLVGSKTYDN
jgi:hypothetical protein